MRLLIISLIILCLPHFSWASSMRRCTLLPVIDDVSGAIGTKVHIQIEEYLKENNWCEYISNSGLMSIFVKYRDNLSEHLKSPKVIETVGVKLGVGSIIKTEMKNEISGIEITVTIYGSNGTDIYFHEKFSQKDKEIDSIVNVIKNWLDIYSKTIPYDAQVEGVLGDQLTINSGKSHFVREGQTVIVKRQKSKKQHPLLKKIVDWETEVLAEGVVTNISDNQSLVRITRAYSEKKILNGDWIRVEHNKPVTKEKNIEEELEKVVPGSLGELSLKFFVSNTSLNTNTPNEDPRMSGNIFGVDLRAEAWITRNYIGGIELIRGVGSLDLKSGNSQKDKVSTTISGYKFMGGYRYLPIGFFYGPRVDLFGGITKFTYDSTLSAEDGFGTHSFSGLFIGVKGSVPISREYRVFANAEFLPFPSFKDEDSVYGSAKNVTSLNLEFGLNYTISTNITFDASLETSSRKSRFSGGYQEVSYKDTLIKLGSTFTF